MMYASSGRASGSQGDTSAHGRRVRFFPNGSLKVAAAVLMLAGGIMATHSAFAEDTASCIDKCKADQKKCIHDGSSPELCEYDAKGCQKACEGK